MRTNGSASASRRIEAVYFDLDDTLVDSGSAWRAGFLDAFLAEPLTRYPTLSALEDPFGAYFVPLLRAEYEASTSSGWDRLLVRNALRRMLATYAERDDACADRAFEIYLEAWPRHLQPFPDAVAAIEAARGHGRIAVITNGPSDEQRLKLERAGLLDHFDALVISEEVGWWKPDGRIFAHAIQSLGVRPEAAVHIGDDLHMDVHGAKSAGLTAVWVNRRGATCGDDATAPDHEVPHLEGLSELLA